MNDQQVQEAIDKTRAWLAPQLNGATTPSLKAKEDAIAYLSELQKVQVVRARLPSFPVMSIPTDEDYMAALGPCGK